MSYINMHIMIYIYTYKLCEYIYIYTYENMLSASHVTLMKFMSH